MFTLSKFRRSLAFTATIGLTWRIIIVIGLVSAGGFLLFEKALHQQKVGELKAFIQERKKRENLVFQQIAEAHMQAQAALKAALASPSNADFDAAFDSLFRDPGDGTRRSWPALFDGTTLPDGSYISGAGAFIANGDALGPAEKRLLVTAFHTMYRAGQAHLQALPSFYFFTPKNQLLIYAPNRHDKLLFYRQDAPASLDFSATELVQITLPANNPDGVTRCTSLQPIIYDQSGETWTTGCHTPVYMGGRHIGAFGTSILLDKLLAEAIADHPPGAFNMLITSDGKLIAHPELTAPGGVINRSLDIAASGDQIVQAAYDLVQAHPGEPCFLAASNATDSYIAAARIDIPGWYFVTVFPQDLIAAEARKGASIILYVGLAGLILAVVTQVLALRKNVIQPVYDLVRRTQTLARHGLRSRQADCGDDTPKQYNELSRLSQSTERMARRLQRTFDTLESQVSERTSDLSKAKEEAEKASMAKTDFLANMSHEIRTPLTGILGMLDILEGEDLPPSAKAYVDMAHQSAAGMLDLVNDILDLSRIEAGKATLKPEATNLSQTVERVLSGLRPLAAQKGLDLNLREENVEDLWLMVDAKALRQILINLVGNAIKFTPTGSVTLALTCLAKTAQSATVRIAVSDTGIGIRADAMDRLFNRFETIEENKGTGRSTGLGLAICKELTHMMGGTIQADSLPGQGTCFHVTLTLARTAPPAQPVKEAAQASAADDILVAAVDDNPINRVLIEKLCRSLGYRCEVKPSGDDLIQFIRSRLEGPGDRPDILVMDINMPGKDGLATLSDIRRLGGWAATIPAIALTAHALEGSRDRFVAAGMQGYVAKPIDKAAFQAEVKACLEAASA